ncbi:MAG TPA: hypothetical protein VGB37_14005 [Candidatus Lokiarchaeia archaeon]
MAEDYSQDEYDYQEYESLTTWNEFQLTFKKKDTVKELNFLYNIGGWECIFEWDKYDTGIIRHSSIIIYDSGKKLRKKTHEINWKIDKKRQLHPDITKIYNHLLKTGYNRAELNIEFFGVRPIYYWDSTPNFIVSEYWKERVKNVNAWSLFYEWYNSDLTKYHKPKKKLSEEVKWIIPPKPIKIFDKFGDYKLEYPKGICIICGKQLPEHKGKGRPKTHCNSDNCRYYYNIEKERRSREKNHETIRRQNINLLGGKPEQSEKGYWKKTGKKLSLNQFQYNNEIYYQKLGIKEFYDDGFDDVNLNKFFKKPPVFIKRTKTLREIYKKWRHEYVEDENIILYKHASSRDIQLFIFKKYGNIYCREFNSPKSWIQSWSDCNI